VDWPGWVSPDGCLDGVDWPNPAGGAPGRSSLQSTFFLFPFFLFSLYFYYEERNTTIRIYTLAGNGSQPDI